MDDIVHARLERDLNDMRLRVEKAQSTANEAVNSISTHEQICALRYENITTHLADIPKIFDILDGLKKHVYTGIGMAIVIGALIKYLG